MTANRTTMTRTLTLGLLGLMISLPVAMADSMDERRAQYEKFLDRLERSSGMDGELALRLMAIGLDNYDKAASPRRSELDSDDVVCYFDKPTGSHITHLVCREFGTTNMAVGSFSMATSVDAAQGASGAGANVSAKTSSILLSFPEREPTLRGHIAMLPGLPEMNERLVLEGMKSGSVPEGLPTVEELDRFVNAYREVGQIADRYDPRIARAQGDERRRLIQESDAAMARAIRSAGLDQARYNEIVDHVSTQPELFEYVKRAL